MIYCQYKVQIFVTATGPQQEREGLCHLQTGLSHCSGRSLPHRGQANPPACLHDPQHRHRHRGDCQRGLGGCLHQRPQEKGSRSLILF